MWGRGQRGNSAACWALGCFQSLPLLPTSKLGPSGADSQVGGFVYIPGCCGSLQQTLLWGWEFLPLPQPPRFFSQRFLGFISPCWNPVLHGLSRSLVVPPGLSTCKCGTTCSASCCLTCSGLPAAALPWVLSAQLPVSAPPTGLDECFFFNSLVVRVPYSLIFWQFWLFFVFKFVVLLFVMRGGKVYLPTPPSWLEVSHSFLNQGYTNLLNALQI